MATNVKLNNISLIVWLISLLNVYGRLNAKTFLQKLLTDIRICDIMLLMNQPTHKQKEVVKMTKTEFIAKPDYTKFYNTLLNRLNISDIELEFEELIREVRGETYISFVSEDIKEHAGLFGNLLTSVHINCDVHLSATDEGSYKMWINCDVRYNMVNGGSNGMKVMDAWFNEIDGWIFDK